MLDETRFDTNTADDAALKTMLALKLLTVQKKTKEISTAFDPEIRQ